MSWLRLDDNFLSHDKFTGLEDRAIVMWLKALAYCHQVPSTNGFVSNRKLAQLKCSPKTRKSLVTPPEGYSSGLWDEVVDPESGTSRGVVIHDFSAYRPSADRALMSEKGRAGGMASGESRRSKSPGFHNSPKQGASSAPLQEDEAELEPRARVPSRPVPSRPNPTPPATEGGDADEGEPPAVEAPSGVMPTAPHRRNPTVMVEHFLDGVGSGGILQARPRGGPFNELSEAIGLRVGAAENPTRKARELGIRFLKYCGGTPGNTFAQRDWLNAGAPESKQAAAVAASVNPAHQKMTFTRPPRASGGDQ
jgi:hypothetical protein